MIETLLEVAGELDRQPTISVLLDAQRVESRARAKVAAALLAAEAAP